MNRRLLLLVLCLIAVLTLLPMAASAEELPALSAPPNPIWDGMDCMCGWTANATEYEFNIYAAATDQLVWTGSSSVPYLDTDDFILCVGEYYYFTVTAKAEGYQSAISDKSSPKEGNYDPELYSLNPTVTDEGFITWTPMENADYYYIRVGDDVAYSVNASKAAELNYRSDFETELIKRSDTAPVYGQRYEVSISAGKRGNGNRDFQLSKTHTYYGYYYTGIHRVGFDFCNDYVFTFDKGFLVYDTSIYATEMEPDKPYICVDDYS